MKRILSFVLVFVATMLFIGCHDSNHTINSVNGVKAVKAVFITGTDTSWNSTDFEDALNGVFGEGNWDRLDMNDENASQAFTDGKYTFVYLEGSDGNDDLFVTFVSNNHTNFESFVSAGGRLFVNSAGWGAFDEINIGFDDLNITYGPNTDDAVAVDTNHSIWSGPYTPVATAYTGSWFAHGIVKKSGMTNIITGADGTDTAGLSLLGEFEWGSGHVVAGAMTAPEHQDPSDNNESMNLLKNILSYAAGI